MNVASYSKLDPYNSMDFAIWINEKQLGMKPADARREALMDELFHRVAVRQCKKVGHKWVDDSYGNMDHGGDGFHCARCGYSVWHQYY